LLSKYKSIRINENINLKIFKISLIVKKLFFFIFILLLGSNSIASQDTVKDSQSSEAILATEKELDQKIIELNKRFMSHAKLLKVMVKILPAQTVMFKGKADGTKCILSKDQEADTNDCIHLELYDFVGSDRGLSAKGLGAKNKYLTIFFAGAASGEADYRKIPPRDVSKIFSRIYLHDFVNEEKVISEIEDVSPLTAPLQNGNYFLFYQLDGFPFSGTEESPSSKGVGRYSLEKVENSTSHDIRNTFKKKFYVKHLDNFDKLFQKIYNFNDRDGNQNYRNNIRVLKDSLNY
jgi:hypothetical protein